MSFEKYEVMKEFLKIAEKDDLLGLKKTAAPAENPNAEDKKVIEEKRQKSPGKSIIEEAHPEPVYIAEARGDGGLVENQIEQQKRIIEMINKMPTGSLVGRYASVALELVKTANACDEINQEEAADLLTNAAVEILSKIAEEDAMRFLEDELLGAFMAGPDGVRDLDEEEMDKEDEAYEKEMDEEEEFPFDEAPGE